MGNQYSLSLFLFHRDLRLEDNTGLMNAMQKSERVIPAFIFDPRQTGEHPYRSNNGLQFLMESLDVLHDHFAQKGVPLFFFSGLPHEVIGTLRNTAKISAVFSNRDYTPFSRKRDGEIEAVCRKNGMGFHVSGDVLLHEPEEVLKKDGSPYTVFTPFFNSAGKHEIRLPVKNASGNYFSGRIPGSFGPEILPSLVKRKNSRISARGGRINGKNILASLSSLHEYKNIRDFPSLHGTTGLSPHLKFGTVSVREAHDAIVSHLGIGHPLLREIYWRDFFTHIAFHFPHVFGKAFHKKYDSLYWNENEKAFHAWREGRTGFPIVDAGMRELRETGGMHNRVRMITASFLTKDLHIDWRMGERYFAANLTDYDPAVNNGNWQWCSSTGCDASPYFRVFNPWIQQKKFDPDAEYIKKWIPELRVLSPKEIHTLSSSEHLSRSYPSPMVDHAKEAEFSKNRFRELATQDSPFTN